MLSKQEIFDKVAKHLLMQMKTSKDGWGHCCYRSPHGLKCAIGALIPDELYNENMEGSKACPTYVGHVGKLAYKHAKALEVGVASGYLSSTCPPKEEHDFIRELQLIHDNFAPEHWRAKLEHFVEREGLIFNGN